MKFLKIKKKPYYRYRLISNKPYIHIKNIDKLTDDIILETKSEDLILFFNY